MQSESLATLQNQVESKIKDVTKDLEDTKSLLAQVLEGLGKEGGRGCRHSACVFV